MPVDILCAWLPAPRRRPCNHVPSGARVRRQLHGAHRGRPALQHRQPVQWQGPGCRSWFHGGRLVGASLNLSNAKNVIVRNLTLEDINPGLIEAGDGITLNNASHIWIDHVRFNLISDGHVDIQSSRNVTLSWNRFDGANPAVCGGQHHYTNGVSNSQMTFHRNFWNRTSGRNPKLEGAATRAHLYNNYWLDVSYFAINASASAQAKIEGNFFANSSRPHWNDGNGLLDANIASNRHNGISVSDPYRHTGARVFGDVALYPYTIDAVDQLPAQLGSGTGPR